MHFVQHKARQPFQSCKVNDHFPGAASRAQHRAATDITIREKGELNRRKPKGRNRKEAPKPSPSTVTHAANKRTPDGKTIPGSQWCIASLR